jgi:hypothetical protein
LQQLTSYAVSEEVPQASCIPNSQEVQSEDGNKFTTTPEMADQIRKYGNAAASGIQTMGDYVGKGIVQAGEWYRSRYQPKPQPTQMNAATMARLEGAKKASSTVAKYTTAVAGAIGSAIGHVAHATTSTLKQQGVGKEGSAVGKVGKVGKAGLIAVVEVFDAMHDAGRKVVKEGATDSATCVQYRCEASAPSCR